MDLTLVAETPRADLRSDCLHAIVSTIIASIQAPDSVLLYLVSNPGALSSCRSHFFYLGKDEDSLNEICSSLSLFAEKESVYVSRTF